MTTTPATTKGTDMTVSLIKSTWTRFDANTANWNRRQHEAMIARTQGLELRTAIEENEGITAPLVRAGTFHQHMVRAGLLPQNR